MARSAEGEGDRVGTQTNKPTCLPITLTRVASLRDLSRAAGEVYYSARSTP
jgi:hypothetical protein